MLVQQGELLVHCHEPHTLCCSQLDTDMHCASPILYDADVIGKACTALCTAL